MTKTFTENDLISALYGELDEAATNDLQRQLIQNEQLQDELLALQEVKSSLDQFEPRAPERLTEKILSKISSLSEVSH